MAKHTLTSIGWMGCKRVYLDVSLEEAKRRYIESDCGYEDMEQVPIDIYEIEDEFRAYEVSADTRIGP